MSPQAPFIAIRLRPHIAEGLSTLTARARSGLSDADKKVAANLLADAYSDVLDHCFVEMLTDINRTHPSSMVKEAFNVAEEIKDKIHHYLGWIVGFFSPERLVPVIGHFNSLVHELELDGETHTYVTFPITPRLAADSERVLGELRDGSAKDLHEGTELLIKVIDAALQPLMIEPKRLMKFNFLVNKTLDGVISLLVGLFHRMLRRLAPHLDRELYPLVSRHLSRFLVANYPLMK